MHFDSLKEWLSWQEGLHPQAIDLGLDRVASVLHALIPNGCQIPKITVAGTNGKGSTIALLEAIYRAQGYRVGAYTSPHILKYNERIRIDGEPVSDQKICQAFDRIEACRGEVSLSYFEFGTLAALDIFNKADLDVLLLEVGLGGRLDAVNIIDTDVAMISSIDIDHAEWLGNTREAIAIEKAGIFRANTPAIVGDPEPPVTLVETAQNCHAKLFCIGQDFHFQCGSDSWDWRFGSQSYQHLPFPALKGSHQFRNAASVLAAISQLQSKLPITENAIRQGLMNVNLKGRFQMIESDVPVLLDVGHNPQAVRTLFEYVSEVFPGKRIHALFAIMKDKDIKSVIEIMRPVVCDWFLVPLDNPRAASTDLLQTIFNDCGITRYLGNFKDFQAAVTTIKQHAQKDDLILVFGSFFLVSAYLAGLDSENAALHQPVSNNSLSQQNNREPNLKKTHKAVVKRVICQ